MSKSHKPLVLDSWAAIAFLEKEPSGAKVAAAIAEAHESGVPVLMTTVNAGEVWYSMARLGSAEEADEVIMDLRDLGLELIATDWELTRIAASFKAKGKMSYADCFGAALAKQKKARLLTGDPEFKQVEKVIHIEWLL